MATGTENTRWRVIGSSVIGASHIRGGIPNQDALGLLQKSGASRSLIVAVSDGHGSPKYFRWKEAVESHIANNPFLTEELDTLEKKDGVAAREAIQNKPVHAYGATILTVLVVEPFILYLQLGDGDILLVSDGGDVERPLPKDERLFANETTSLSSQNAWPDFRFSFQTLAGPPPALILLSTDGYANSFVSEEAFLKVGKDLLEMIRADGLDEVNQSLETWLSEASAAGSGDDITLAIICRADALRSPDQVSPAAEASTVEASSSAETTATDNDSGVPAVLPADSLQVEPSSAESSSGEESSPSEPPSEKPSSARQQSVAPEEEKQ